MNRSALLACCAATLLLAPCLAPAAPPAEKKPTVEVVFCLDTTGSMRDLIEGAKQKIWAISNQIASGKPTPNVKIGLVAYRDKKDAYITQVHDLSEDLDAVYGKLKTFAAAGGGDTPEHVNQALDEAVNKIRWSTDKKTLRIIFLVGDAPPHMDYTDDIKYPETCKKACEKGIIINTIQCGNNGDCTTAWKDIAVKSEGTYVQVEQSGGVVATIATPYDKRLAEINGELASTTLVFGENRALRAADDRKRQEAKALAPGAAAERAAFQAKKGEAASYDLLDQVKQGKVQLEKLKKDELPNEMKNLTLEQQKEYLKKLEDKRAALRKEALELDKKRTEYIAKKQAESKDPKKAGFDNQVLQMLRKQAKQHGVEY